MPALTFLRFWREGLIGVVLIFAAIQWGNARHWEKRYHSEHEARLQVVADFTAFANGVREKSEGILAKAKARNARIAAEYRAIEKEEEIEVRNRIAAAVARVRAQGGTGSGSSGNPGAPVAVAPSGPDGAGQKTLVDVRDVEICTEATVKAESWQEWWKRVSAVQR